MPREVRKTRIRVSIGQSVKTDLSLQNFGDRARRECRAGILMDVYSNYVRSEDESAR